MAVHLIVTFRALPQQRDAFIAMLEGVKEGLPKVPGCLGVTAYAHHEDRQSFTLVEHWASSEEHGAHLARLQASGDWERLAALLASPPTSAYCTML